MGCHRVRSRFLGVWLLLVGSAASADFPVQPPVPSPPSLPPRLSEFLDPRGHLDLESLRRLGYEGELDLSGWNVRIDGESGKPTVEPDGGAPPGSEGDAPWWKGFSLGTNGSVWCVAIYGGELIVGGVFTEAGGVEANRIARWDGNAFHPLGGGMDGAVRCLAEYGGELIAGGSFGEAGGVRAACIARWDGSTWRPLGLGMAHAPVPGVVPVVIALAVHDGYLVAGGCFDQVNTAAMRNIARWDGTSWRRLDSGVIHTERHDGGYVLALTVYRGGLLAGGDFNRAGGTPANLIARWSSETWQPLRGGLENRGSGSAGVENMAVGGEDLVVGGYFTHADGIQVNGVARWNGARWSAMDRGFSWPVEALCVLGGRVYAAESGRVHRWDGQAWRHLGSVHDNVSHAVVEALAVFNGTLVAGGDFSYASGYVARHLALWNGTNFVPLGQGLNGGPPFYGAVRALTLFDGDVVAAGHFALAGSTAVQRIARWDGTRWHAVGSGLNGAAHALHVHRGELVAGGAFTEAGGVPASHVAAWNGSGWRALGTGVGGEVVEALATYGGDLVAGGDFLEAGGVMARGVAGWDGTDWRPLGSGVEGGVAAFAEYGGELIAGGWFSGAGEVDANSVAAWNGAAWRALGTGLRFIEGGPARVLALATHRGHLFAGGEFYLAGESWAPTIARWDGTAWSPLGPEVHGAIHALASFGRDLVAGGQFGPIGEPGVNYIGRWNGQEWSRLGSGVSGIVDAFAATEDHLFAGGEFTVAGGARSFFIARWDDFHPVPVTLALFTAHRRGSDAVLRWRVTRANDHAGFQLFRRDPGGERIQVIPELFSGRLAYEHVDRTVGPEASEYWLRELTLAGAGIWHGPALLPPAIATGPPLLLLTARPNPFGERTSIDCLLPGARTLALRVFDVSGRCLRTLETGRRAPGLHTVVWDGRDGNGAPLAAGVYFLRLESSGETRTIKLLRAR